MAREMQFDYGTTITANLKGCWVDAALRLWDHVAAAWVDAATATLANCLTAMTRLAGGDYCADAPAGIDLTQPYTIRYYDAVTPTLGTHIGVQAWQPVPAAAIAASVWNAARRTLTGTGGAIGPTAGANLAPIPFGPIVPKQTLDLSACVSYAGQPATVEVTAGIVYTICHRHDGPVTGHIAVPLTPSAVLYDTLQTDGEASNYNFRFRPSQAASAPFAKAGHYSIAVTFTVAGQQYFANFLVEATW